MSLRIRTVSVALLALLAFTSAGAQNWPQRPIKIVVPYTPGGASDITARLLAERLSGPLGQPVVVENRAGASGTIGTGIVAHANPDGYTLALVASSHVINKALFPDLNYDPLRSFAPITQTANVQLVMVVPSTLGVRTVQQFIQLAKSRPGLLNYASSGTGSNPQLFAEMFAQSTGIRLQHVPYTGSTAAYADLFSGRTQVMFDALAAVMPHVKSGKLQVLAVAGQARSPLLPDVPTVSESGVPSYGATSWGALLAPAGTPESIIKRLNEEAVRALRSEEIRARLKALGAEVVASTPQQLGELMAREEARYTKLLESLRVKTN